MTELKKLQDNLDTFFLGTSCDDLSNYLTLLTQDAMHNVEAGDGQICSDRIHMLMRLTHFFTTLEESCRKVKLETILNKSRSSENQSVFYRKYKGLD